MNRTKNSILIPSLIFLALLLAFSPVFLSTNYIRQDDLMWEIWPWMKISDFGFLYKSTVFHLVRPICMLLLYTADLIAINITDAVYIRFIAVIILCILAILLYHWQLLYNSNRALAASFATASFTLPAYQVFAATANYSLIIIAILMTFGAAYYWHDAYFANNADNKSRYYRIGCLLFFASLLTYPLSSMYIWVLLVIAYLNTSTDVSKRKFIPHAAYVSIKMMIYYYLFCRLVHLVFHVKTSGDRSAVLDTSQIGAKLKHIFDITGWHSNLWLWNSWHSFYQTPILFMTGLFLFALIKHEKFAHATWMFLITLLFYLLSYSPILASSEILVTFRYAITTMPILLYVTFWSINVLMSNVFFKHGLLNKLINTLNSIVLICIALFGLTYANIMLADGIVGPHTKDFDSIQQQLNEKVLPLLKQNKQVVINAIACDKTSAPIGDNIPMQLEYGMRICQYQQQVIGAIIHSLRKMGYASNFNKKNELSFKDNEIIVNNTPWGTLVVSSVAQSNADLRKYTNNNREIITIDTRILPAYQQYDFYHQLYSRAKT